MSISFNTQRWERIQKDYKSFWEGTLERPLVNIVLTGYESSREKSVLPLYNHFLRYDLSVSAEDIVDAIDYELSRRKYIGDAFPLYVFSTPTVAASYMGAKVVVDDISIWMKAPEKLPLESTSFIFNPENVYWKRMLELYKEGIKKWGDSVLLGMASLGGNLDLVMPFFSNEVLLMSVYDEPEELKRLLWEAHKCWWTYFERINELTSSTNRGFSCWATYFSDQPTYILQCDFAAMLSPQSFKELAVPEITATAKKLGNVYFHLDGPDMVRHLDMILEIPNICGVQWIPGPKYRHSDKLSLDVHKKVHSAGKLLNIIVGSAKDLEDVEVVIDALGSTKGMYVNTGFSAGACFNKKHEDNLRRFLERYSVPE